MSDGLPVVIRELDGSRTVTLEGSSLPEQGVRVGAEARLVYSWYAGQRVASVQALGTMESPITFRGRLSDFFAGQGTAAFIGEQIAAILGGQRRLEITWGTTIVRRGHLRRADRIYEREGLIQYEFEFWPDSNAEAAQVQPPRPPASTSNDAIERLDRLLTAQIAAREAYALLLRVRGLSSSARASVPQ